MHFWRDQTKIAINLHSCARGKSPTRRLAGAVQICKTESARPSSSDGSATLQKLSFCKLVQAGWVSARLNVQIPASQCGLARMAVACENWRTGPAKLAQLGRAEQCKTELRSLFAPKRAWLFCYFCPRVNRHHICLFVLGCKFPNFIWKSNFRSQVLRSEIWKCSYLAVWFSDSYRMYC